jgi:hypothetical protein
MRAWMAVIGLACAFGAQAAPKVAVTDLAYEAQVQEYIHSVNAQNNGQSSMYNASQSSSYSEYESSKSYIQQAELRKFGGDIKGEILKTGMFELIQGKPYTAEAEEDVYDVIRRIKNARSQAPTMCCSAPCRTSTSRRTSTPWPTPTVIRRYWG